MKKFCSVLLLSLASFAFSATVYAHGSNKPQHGGSVQIVGETSFELVTRADGVELYVMDDGEEMESAGLTAKLTIVNSGAKSEVVLKPAAGNKFEAPGVTVASGSQVAVQLTNKTTQAKVSANFTIK
jgi:hypothetical protein